MPRPYPVTMGDKPDESLLEGFLVSELFAEVCELMIPGPHGCDACDHRYPRYFHACTNYCMPYHFERLDDIAQYLLPGSTNLWNRITSHELWNKWNLFCTHAQRTDLLQVPITEWKDVIKKLISKHVNDPGIFWETYNRWYEKYPSKERVELQDIVYAYNPDDGEDGHRTFDEEYRDIYGKDKEDEEKAKENDEAEEERQQQQ